MSRVVDVSHPDRLSEADALYAFDRGMLTEEQMEELGFDPRRSVLTDPHPSLTPNFGDANTTGRTQRDLDRAQQEDGDESLEPAEASLTEPQLEGVKAPEPVTREEDEDDDEIEVTKPEEGWQKLKAEQLRVACVERDLSTSGNKEALVDRLDRYDRGEEEEPEEV